MELTYWAEITLASWPFDRLSRAGPGLTAVSVGVGAIRQALGPQLVGLLHVLLPQRADGVKAAGQTGLELLPVGQGLGGLPRLVLDAEGLEEDAEAVRGAIGEEHLDVLGQQLHGALAVPGELGEQPELLQRVTLRRRFAVFDAQDQLLELVASQQHGGFADHPAAGRLAGGVQPLHRRAAPQRVPVASLHRVSVLALYR